MKYKGGDVNQRERERERQYLKDRCVEPIGKFYGVWKRRKIGRLFVLLSAPPNRASKVLFFFFRIWQIWESV